MTLKILITVAAVFFAAIFFAHTDSMARGGGGFHGGGIGRSFGWGRGGSDMRGFGMHGPAAHDEGFRGREGRHDFRFDHHGFEHHGGFEHGRGFEHHGRFGHRDHFDHHDHGHDRRFARWNDGHWHGARGFGGHDRNGPIQEGQWQRTPGLGDGASRVSDFQGQWHL